MIAIREAVIVEDASVVVAIVEAVIANNGTTIFASVVIVLATDQAEASLVAQTTEIQ